MTQIREATQESKVTTIEMLSCIECGTMVKAYEGMHETVDGEICDFPSGYATCPPPADDGDSAAQDTPADELEQAEIEEVGMWLEG